MTDGQRSALKIVAALGAVAAVVVGCHYVQREDDRQAAVERGKQARAEYALKERLAKPLEPRVIQVGDNQIVVLEIPMATSVVGAPYYESQRCIVWRDAALRTAAMSCQGETGLQRAGD